MCTVSMVMDHYWEKWRPLVPDPPYVPPWQTAPAVPPISPEEVAEFRRLLERAREYDRKHNQPDCELDEKRQALKTLAEQLGVDISFVDAGVSG